MPNKYLGKRQRRYPFSDKASLILRELLKGPKRQWGIRELAGKVGLNPGYVPRLAKIDVPRKVQYALSVQAGAGLVAPHVAFKEVHLYVDDVKDIEFIKKELDLKDADQGANLVLMIPSYKHSVFYDSREIEGLWGVSDIQSCTLIFTGTQSEAGSRRNIYTPSG